MVLKAGGHSLELLFGLCTVFQTQHEAASPGLSPGQGINPGDFQPTKAFWMPTASRQNASSSCCPKTLSFLLHLSCTQCALKEQSLSLCLGFCPLQIGIHPGDETPCSVCSFLFPCSCTPSAVPNDLLTQRNACFRAKRRVFSV